MYTHTLVFFSKDHRPRSSITTSTNSWYMLHINRWRHHCTNELVNKVIFIYIYTLMRDKRCPIRCQLRWNSWFFWNCIIHSFWYYCLPAFRLWNLAFRVQRHCLIHFRCPMIVHSWGTSCAYRAKEDRGRLLVGNEDIASTNGSNRKKRRKKIIIIMLRFAAHIFPRQSVSRDTLISLPSVFVISAIWRTRSVTCDQVSAGNATSSHHRVRYCIRVLHLDTGQKWPLHSRRRVKKAAWILAPVLDSV